MPRLLSLFVQIWRRRQHHWLVQQPGRRLRLPLGAAGDWRQRFPRPQTASQQHHPGGGTGVGWLPLDDVRVFREIQSGVHRTWWWSLFLWRNVMKWKWSLFWIWISWSVNKVNRNQSCLQLLEMVLISMHHRSESVRLCFIIMNWSTYYSIKILVKLQYNKINPKNKRNSL